MVCISTCGNRLFAHNITNHPKLNQLNSNLNRENADCLDSSDEILKTPIDGVSCHQHLGFKEGMAIASLNINGLRSYLDEVQPMMKRLRIHILALNETKLDSSIPKELTKVWLPANTS